MKQIIIYIVFDLVLSFSYADDSELVVGSHLKGPNVCKFRGKYIEQVSVLKSVPYTETVDVWCR